jgi:IMP dehydrogenase
MATNMSSITEYLMMKAMNDLGGVGVLHRFMDSGRSQIIVKQSHKKNLCPVISSVGVGKEEYERAVKLIDIGVDALMIDVAHAHSRLVEEMIVNLSLYKNVELIVGNVATSRGVSDLLNFGASAIRVGVGGGSRCLTRTVTGHGVPNLTAIIEAAKVRDKYFTNTQKYVPLILDGGIKNSGDMVKALYFGADIVSIGGLLAGTDETPGEIIFNEFGADKKYYGMSSKDALTLKGGKRNGIAAEGFSASVPYRGSVVPIIEELVGGIRSGLTYSGARNIMELRQKGEAMLISPAAQHESKMY